MSNAKLVKPKKAFWTINKAFLIIRILYSILAFLYLLFGIGTKIFTAIYLLIFPFFCWLYLRFTNSFTLKAKRSRGQDKISLSGLFWIFLFPMFYNLMTMNYTNAFILPSCICAFILFAVLMYLFTRFTKEYKYCRHMLHLGIFYFVLFSLLVTLQFNSVLDFSNPHTEQAAAITADLDFPTSHLNRRITSNDFIPSFKVYLKTQENNQKIYYTNLQTWSQIKEGDIVYIQNYSGAFGLSYQKISLTK